MGVKFDTDHQIWLREAYVTARTSKPLQLSLLPNHVRLIRSIPDANRHRFYLLRTLPTLFGDRVLLREWGRIGSPGRVRRDRHPSEGEAVTALAKLARQKHRRGYALQEMQEIPRLAGLGLADQPLMW
jgi:predicted DNA-binding WGR domain protein